MWAVRPCICTFYIYYTFFLVFTRYGLKISLLSRIPIFIWSTLRAERTWDLIYMHKRVFGTQHIAYFVNTASLRVTKSSRRLLADLRWPRKLQYFSTIVAVHHWAFASLLRIVFILCAFIFDLPPQRHHGCESLRDWGWNKTERSKIPRHQLSARTYRWINNARQKCINQSMYRRRKYRHPWYRFARA